MRAEADEDFQLDGTAVLVAEWIHMVAGIDILGPHIRATHLIAHGQCCIGACKCFRQRENLSHHDKRGIQLP